VYDFDAVDNVTLNDDVVLMSAEDIEEHISDVVNLQKELLETKNKNEFHSRKVGICVCMYVCICVFIYVCICMYMYMYVYVCICRRNCWRLRTRTNSTPER
jgi:hypothetical protein